MTGPMAVALWLTIAGVDGGSPPPLAAAEVDEALRLDCQSCHGLAYIRQQRLTARQWIATLNKMRGWGALLEEARVPPLADALSQRHGPATALADFAVEEVPPFRAEPAMAGDASRGKAMFEARCLACHGPDARGAIGVNLGDRPLLQQAGRFGAFVKAGRGRMPPHLDLTPGQVGDLLAWLGTR